MLNLKNILTFQICSMHHHMTDSTVPSCQLQEEPLQWAVQAKCQHVSQHYYTHSQPVNRNRLAENRTTGWFATWEQNYRL